MERQLGSPVFGGAVLDQPLLEEGASRAHADERYGQMPRAR